MPLLTDLPLITSGAQILGASGQPVRLEGVNWSGAHQNGLVPAGLDKLAASEIAGRIADLGLNHVRLTFALGTFVNNDGSLKTAPVADQWRLAANPAWQGSMSPWEVYQAVVAELTGAGVAVIPNCHMLYQGTCCSTADGNGLWYNANWPASTFYACWKMVVAALSPDPLVIGFDLKNEPRPATINGQVLTPSWGDGNPATDLRMMYADIIPQLRAAGGQGKLYIVEGPSYDTDMTQAGGHPVGTGPGTVASLHDYAWDHPGNPVPSQADYNAAMDARAGYLVTQNKIPLWIGEFGCDSGNHDSMNSGWATRFINWAGPRGVSWCWWQLSAEGVLGIEPQTNVTKFFDGDREGYGLFAGDDWRGTQQRILDAMGVDAG